MEQKEIIIKIQNDRILFNPQLSIKIGQTSIPFGHLRFRTNENIYWKVEILEYSLSEKCLKVKIIDYQITDIADFARQTTNKEIESLAFTEKYDWTKLRPLLTSFTKSKFVNQLINSDEVFAQPKERPLIQHLKPHLQISQRVFEPIVRKITDGFWINFNDAQFMLGYVTFKKRINKLTKILTSKLPMIIF